MSNTKPREWWINLGEFAHLNYIEKTDAQYYPEDDFSLIPFDKDGYAEIVKFSRDPFYHEISSVKPLQGPSIHVIEKSEYDRVVAELNQLKEKYEPK